MKLLLNQDIENAFDIITDKTQGSRYTSLLHEAIATKWKKLGHLIFCYKTGSSNIDLQEEEVKEVS